MILGRRAVRVYQVPGFGAEIGIRILADHEIDSARLAAQQHVASRCQKLRIDPEKAIASDPELLDREIERQIVWRACVDPESAAKPQPDPFFPSDQDVRELDGALVRDLFNVYLDHQEYISPRLSLSAEEVDRALTEAGKGRLEVALRLCEPDTLRLFVTSLAHRLLGTLPTSSASTSSPSSAPPEE